MPVIQSDGERDAALIELERLRRFLQEVERDNPEHGSTKAGIHKMMARIHEELMQYEARRELEAARANRSTKDELRVTSPVETLATSE